MGRRDNRRDLASRGKRSLAPLDYIIMGGVGLVVLLIFGFGIWALSNRNGVEPEETPQATELSINELATEPIEPTPIPTPTPLPFLPFNELTCVTTRTTSLFALPSLSAVRQQIEINELLTAIGLTASENIGWFAIQRGSVIVYVPVTDVRCDGN